MASPPSSTQTLGDRSHFKPTVTLSDWWLVKSEENDEKRRLAVAGVSSAPQEIPRRVFYSAPISKKYDVFTLETTDGVCIILDGIINKQQTIANGFPDEVARRFQLGFYAGWEKGVAEFLGGDSNTTGVSERISDLGSEGKKNSSPTSVHFSQEETRTPYEHIGSTYFQWIGRSRSPEGNQKNPMSGCSMKHKSTKMLPSSDAFESVGGATGAAVQSGGEMKESERCPSNSARRVTRFFSEFLRSKWTNHQMVDNGLNSEKKTTDSLLTVSETVNNSQQNGKCEVGGKGVKSSSPTSVHLSLEDDSHEQVSCEDMCDAEFPKRLSSKLSLNSSIDDSKIDELVNYATEEETEREDFGSTGLQCIGIPKTLEENEKGPVSGCSIKHNHTEISPSIDVGVVASGVTIPSAGEIDISNIYPRNSGGRVSGDLSIITRSKGKTKQIVGNGLNSEQNTMDSVPAVETVSSDSTNVDSEVGGRHMFESFLSYCEMAEDVLNSSLTPVHFPHETPNEKVHCEDRLDIEYPKQISTNLSSNSTIDDSKIDDLMNRAAEVELDAENIGLTEFQSVGRPQAREENEKNPASEPEVELDAENIGLTEFQSVGRPETREENEKSPASEPASEALEILDGAVDANAQSGGKMDISERSPSKSAGRVSQLFSGIIRTKEKKKQTVSNGLNSETNTIDSVPAVSGSVSNLLQSDCFETVGNGMPRPSDSELQEPVDVNVVRKLDFDFVEDDMEQTSNAKEGQDFGNVTAQVGEGESGAKEENKSRKRNMRQVTVDTQQIHFIPEVNKKKKVGVNKKKNSTPSTLEVKKKKDGTPEVIKRRKVSSSTLEVSKKKKLTPLTLEVNNKKEASLSIPKVNTKKRKVSSLDGSKKRMSSPPTLEVNSKKAVSLSTSKVNTKKRKISPSTLEVSKKNKSSPSTLEVNKKKEASLSTPKVNTKTSIISPESMSAGRSRSGRLQLPPLEFWRNQSAVYDKDHGVIGIQEELPRVTASRGWHKNLKDLCIMKAQGT
ncbi:uncharacterized protein LOC112193374 isoform X1 [Rosa chinensis]|uniref:uncharacterized protein LOC112193374 isoform X1 n=1 Tax=Rosa chinensis TaxID=74649 RepID=UPI000D0900A0|nr:uncharacterized protein LOC112193374 isoform X1 [Rosa chinensis]